MNLNDCVQQIDAFSYPYCFWRARFVTKAEE